MQKFNPEINSVAMWVVSAAIGEDFDLIDKMSLDENDLYDVEFKVGGVELDFNNVVECIAETYENAVNDRAKELLKEKFDTICNEAQSISERLDKIDSALFLKQKR